MDNTPELLQSVNLEAFLASLKDEYDYVFIDTAPILRVTDTVIATREVSGSVVLVAVANKTPKPILRYAVSLLGDADILGLVLNAIEMNKISSFYYSYQYPNYAYYSNAYAYGYSYGETVNVGLVQKMRYALRRLTMRSIRDWLRRTLLPMD